MTQSKTGEEEEFEKCQQVALLGATNKQHFAPGSNHKAEEIQDVQLQTSKKLIDETAPIICSSNMEYDFVGGRKCGEVSFEVSAASTKVYTWQDHGFQLRVPKGALSSGETTTVTVTAFVGGTFDLPEDIEQIGAFYLIHSTHAFQQEVTVCLQHCALIESDEECKHFKFLIGKRPQPHLPYKFTVVNGSFASRSQFASISVSDFSIFTLICKWAAGMFWWVAPHIPEPRREYMAQVWYKKEDWARYRIAVIVTQHVPSQLKLVNYEYGKPWKLYEKFEIKYVGNHDSIKVEMSPISRAEEGDRWEVSPILPEMVKFAKKVVDSSMRKDPPDIPKCHFIAKIGQHADDRRKKNELELKINLSGSMPSSVNFSVSVHSQVVPRAGPQDRVEQEGDECSQGDFMNEVAAEIPNAWRLFGISLGIKNEDLITFDDQNRGKALYCFADVYSMWKKENIRPVTWSVVIEILETNVLRENQLANTLRGNHSNQ